MLYVAVRHDARRRADRPALGAAHRRSAGTSGPLLFTIALALSTALLAAAALLAWGTSVTVTRRLDEMAVVARRYAAQDYSVRIRDVATDEIGSVARQLDDSIQALRTSLSELSRDRARMSAILAGMVEGVLVVDEQGVAQLANDAARRLLRLRDDPIGRRYLELIRHPDIVAQISRCLRDEPTDVQELTLAQDPVQVVIARTTRVDTPTSSGVVLVLHDITDLRRADRIRRDFVANVSHELRTPLTAIRGYVEALLDSPLDEAETRRFLEIIARHSSRMERLVKDLLRLTRLDAGQEPLERAPCAVEALFGGVVNELEPLLDSREQQVTMEVDDGGVDHRRRPGEAPRRAAQPGRERVELLARADDDLSDGAPRAASASCSTWPTRARAFPRPICGGSSSASTASTRRARARPAAPASACRSSSTSSACTAATSPPATAPPAAPLFTVRLPTASATRNTRVRRSRRPARRLLSAPKSVSTK